MKTTVFVIPSEARNLLVIQSRFLGMQPRNDIYQNY